MQDMLNQETKDTLIKQQYRIVGKHSGVKICGWTKNMLKGDGGCYKLKFYGINSIQCLQMTSSFSCANRCIFCWRDYKAPVATTWTWDVDEPEFILDGCVHAQEKLLEGFKGNDKVVPGAFDMSKSVKHVALSLNGEPINYPKINELITLIHKRGMSTFLVTNGQYPEEIENLVPITQLYLSMDSPNEKICKEVGKPLFPNYWERFNRSLDAMAKKKERTAVRITMIKGHNDVEPENYAAQIKRADVDFVEIKAYMHIGASQERLSRDCMPSNIEVLAFTRKVVEYLDDYEIVSEHIPSRVILLAKKKLGTKLWIDFKKWNELANSGRTDISYDEYSTEIPKQFLGIKLDTLTPLSEDRDKHLEEIKVLIDKEKPEYMSVCETGWEDQLE